MNRQPGCAGNDGQRNVSSPRLSGIRTGNILGAAAKLLGLTVMAIPAMLKARRQLQLPAGGEQPGVEDNKQPVIEIEAEPVEEPDVLKKT